MTEEKEFTTIQLEIKTRDRLKKQGSKGETYDTLINRVLDELYEALEDLSKFIDET